MKGTQGKAILGISPIAMCESVLKTKAAQAFEDAYDAQKWVDGRMKIILAEKLHWPSRDAFVANEVAKLRGQHDMFAANELDDTEAARQRRLNVHDSQPTFRLRNDGYDDGGSPVLTTDVWRIAGDPREVHVEVYIDKQVASIVVNDHVMDTRTFRERSLERLRMRLMRPKLTGKAREKFIADELSALEKQFNFVDCKPWQMAGDTTRRLSKRAKAKARAEAERQIDDVEADGDDRVPTYAELFGDDAADLPQVAGGGYGMSLEAKEELDALVANVCKGGKLDRVLQSFTVESEPAGDDSPVWHIDVDVFDNFQQAKLISPDGRIVDAKTYEARSVEGLRRRLRRRLAFGERTL